MDLLFWRSAFDLLICLILLIQIILTAKYYFETKIPDYLVFSIYFLCIDINSLMVALYPLYTQLPTIYIDIFVYIQFISFFNAWGALLLHDILFFNIDRYKKRILIFGFLIVNIVFSLLFLFHNFIRFIFAIIVFDDGIMFVNIVLTATLFVYFFKARISEVDILTTRKVRRFWILVILMALLTSLMQLFGFILLPGLFANYVIADLLYLLCIFVIFFISARYPQSFLLSKNHVLRALKLYSRFDEITPEKKLLENTKSDQIRDYLFLIKQYIRLDEEPV